MGGGLGLGGINSIVKSIDGFMENIQIIAVAGRNNRRDKTQGFISQNRQVYGFVNNMHELMELSDCIISKPEAYQYRDPQQGKPLVIFSPSGARV